MVPHGSGCIEDIRHPHPVRSAQEAVCFPVPGSRGRCKCKSMVLSISS